MWREGQVDEQRPTPAGLPAWPQWLGTARQITITGRHLTPQRARVAQFLGKVLTLALLAFPGWYYWGFKNLPPDWLRIAINAVGEKLGYILNFEQRKWIYAGLWAVGWLLFRLWQWMIVCALYPLLKRRSTVRFTADTITLPGVRGRLRTFDRRRVEPITFMALQDADLPWRLLKARSPERATALKESRIVSMQYGLAFMLVAEFIAPEAAQPFAAVCQYANSYRRLEADPTEAAEEATEGEIENERDV